MQIKTLYRYSQGNVVVDSPNPPKNATDLVERYRLVADEGYLLTKDDGELYTVVDINKEGLSLWYEIEDTSEETPQESERTKGSAEEQVEE